MPATAMMKQKKPISTWGAVLIVGTTALISVPRLASAQPAERFLDRQESQKPRPSLPDEPPRAPGQPPFAQDGFQLAFRTGATFPAGKIDDAEGDSLSDTFGWQVPVLAEIGAKPAPWLFVGLYGGFGFGGVSSSIETQCNGAGLSCSSRTSRVGLEGIFYLLPAGWVDPWLGYGLGYESTVLIFQAQGASSTQSASGFEMAHLMAGFDVRISHSIGLGPFIDVAIGRYGSVHRSFTPADGPADVDIEKTAFHEWITLGTRLVVFP